MSGESAEEYLECIYDLTRGSSPAKTNDIAARLNISPGSATEMVQKLSGEGYLDYERYGGAVLTEEGMIIATKIKRKHRLLESFLVNVLGMNKNESHQEACRLEHAVSDESEKRICQMVNNPELCPDGDPIPVCEDDCALCASEPSIALSRMKVGDEGSITHLQCDERPEKIRRLISMGFVPGREVCVEEETPAKGPLVVRLGDTRIALGREYASLVHVSSARPDVIREPGRRRKGRGRR
ncbi:MAG: metal-dependent transcriptional regulator [Methanomassiliicoccales archaeon]|nr:metal-dependent transcriptional regulator [Methanomassiliicoccales archaeon]